jgi:RHS repeat-associated protein
VYAHYQYDNAGNRVRKFVYKPGTGWESVTYVDGMFEYHHREDTSGSTVEEKNYFRLQGGLEIRIGAYSDDTEPDVIYQITDHLNSITIRLTDTGSLIDREEYYPYGESSLRTFDKKRYRYIGKERDNESGLYCMGVRYYAPWLASFTSTDPKAKATAAFSPYNYSYSNPIVFHDPSGMSSEKAGGGKGSSSGGKAGGGNKSGGKSGPNKSGNKGKDEPKQSTPPENNIQYPNPNQSYVSESTNPEPGKTYVVPQINPNQNATINPDNTVTLKVQGEHFYDKSTPITVSNETYVEIMKTGSTGGGSSQTTVEQRDESPRAQEARAYWAKRQETIELMSRPDYGSYQLMSGAVNGFVGEASGYYLFKTIGTSYTAIKLLKFGKIAEKVTTEDGFLFGSIKFTAPTDIKVGLYASENTLKYGTFRFSTIAPKFLTETESFGRRALQITEEFQPQLGPWSEQIIPKGAEVRFGLIGPQKGQPIGTWFQFYTPTRIPFIK